ncbi:hypothetical protein MTE01_32370 [Microbacterium testaceum]|uniref:Uncharacterized protein n=1 Tax=Microbacterium testaceum TaxID=2033 RepID=A0A4Y3QQ40_MICTE|nr:hypothetical protein [Microbacterium testaceum]GEB47292.1 hypothetical protein MTE01_32370 [Microbacterium testaceum]
MLDLLVQCLLAVLALLALCVSVTAVVPAFLGLMHARTANKVAEGANILAAQANTIALNADDLSRRTEARATEPYDVEWTVGWVDEHHLFIANQGLDVAHNVRFRIGGPWGAARNAGPKTLEPWDDFSVPCEVALSQGVLESGQVELRIVWTSPAGTPHRESLTFPGKMVFQHRRAVG